MTEVLAGLTVQSLILNGASMRGDLIAAITSADIERTIEGADTLTIGLADPHLSLLRSGLLSSRATLSLPSTTPTKASQKLARINVKNLSDAHVRRLRSVGWRGNPNDANDDLMYAQMVDVTKSSAAYVASLKKRGWKADPHDKREALYFPPEFPPPTNGHAYELAGIKKSGRRLTAVFEDLAAASLRRHKAPRKIAAGQMTRVDFARLLVAEERWVRFVAPVKGARTKTELSRGKVATKDQRAEPEDTWDALGRLADDVGWRRFTLNNQVWFLPETHLLAGAPRYSITEGDPGIDSIDFDFDIGKPVATVTIVARAEQWAASPGTVIEIRNLGPVTGKWLVASVSKSLFSTSCSIKLTKARPNLPEPSESTTGGEPSATLASGKANDGSGLRLGNVRAHVRAAAGEIGGKFGVRDIGGVAERSGRSDHPLGLALDFMTYTDKAKGDGIVAYGIEHATRLKVKYIIWQQRIWTPGAGWRNMASRGSPTADHRDHPHFSFNP